MQEQIKGDFYNLSNFTWISEYLAVYETLPGNDRCIITWSRSERDRKIREDVLDKIRIKLASNRKQAKKPHLDSL